MGSEITGVDIETLCPKRKKKERRDGQRMGCIKPRLKKGYIMTNFRLWSQKWFRRRDSWWGELQRHDRPTFVSLVAQSYPTLCDPIDDFMGLQPTSLLCPWGFSSKNTGVGCYTLLQGIFQTQGSNTGLPHCRWILYWLSHQGSQTGPELQF